MLAEVDNSLTKKKIIIQRDTTTKTDISGSELRTWEHYKKTITFTVVSTSTKTKIFPSQQEHRQITELPNKNLKKAILITVEPDEDGFIAKTIDLPLYGYGDDREEAINELKHEIESLYDDLMTDDNFTEEWLERKKLLKTWIKD